MTERTKWLFLLILIALIGGGIVLAGWMIWKRSQGTSGIQLDEKKIQELRGRLDENPRSLFVYDPRISYRLKPSFRGLRHDSPTLPHVTNSRGILGEQEVNPDPKVRKILFLGDSVVYGEHVPYEEIFVSRMAKAAGPTYQLLNAGCPGWSTHQELLAYRLYFADLPIDMVVIVFTLNDLLDFEWVWQDESSFQMSAELRGLGGLVHSNLTARAIRDLRNLFWNRSELQPLANLNNTCLSAYLPERWGAWREKIRPALIEIAAKKRVIMAIMPARPQLEALNRGADPETVLFPQEQMRNFCAKMGIECVDLLPAFFDGKGKYDTGLFLVKENGLLHLSAEGHQRVAEYLLPIIEEEISDKKPGPQNTDREME